MIKIKYDQFYTNPNVANKIVIKINQILKHVINFNDITWLEPSAGNGSFINALNNFYSNPKIIAYDILPLKENITKNNFLELKPRFNINLITIGNPPFGHKGKKAIEFINKCFEWSNIIIFILPIQFQRYLTQKQISPFLKLIYSSEKLPNNSFIFNNKKYNVNCIYQIWVNINDTRFINFQDIRIKTRPIITHIDFKTYTHNNTKQTLKFFNKEKYKWDFAVHRQGYYDYNEIIYNENDLKPNRQYLFIKSNNIKALPILKKIDFKMLSKNNTTIPGFSNSDLIKEYEKNK